MQLLNPLKAKVSPEKIEEHWYNILEQYYRETDESKYIEFISELKKRAEKDLEIIVLEAAYVLHTLGIQSGTDSLKEKGLFGDVKSKLLQKRTKYIMFLAKEQAKNKETAKSDFFEIVGDITIAQKINLNIDMLLPEWVGILKSLKKQIELDNKLRNSIKK